MRMYFLAEQNVTGRKHRRLSRLNPDYYAVEKLAENFRDPWVYIGNSEDDLELAQAERNAWIGED